MNTDFNLKLYSDETNMAEKGQNSPMYINCSNFTTLRIKYFPLFIISSVQLFLALVKPRKKTHNFE